MNQNTLNLKPENLFFKKARIKLIFTNVKTGRVRESKWYKNLVVNAGKNAILDQLAALSTKSNPAQLTYGALGTDNTAPVIGNTTLGAEIADAGRAVLSGSSRTDQTVEIRCFFNTSEGNGTLKEFGWFGEEATAVENTGTMFNHVAIDETKSTSETLTVVQQWSL